MDAKQLTTLFEKNYGATQEPVHCFFAPGRVNLIGEHIDYNGGFVFPAALSVGIWGALRFRDDNRVCLKSTNAELAVNLELTDTLMFLSEDGWANYPKGVFAKLFNAGMTLKGCDILFSGNLPDGAGLSSSAAILVLTAFMLRSAAGETEIDRVALARFCQQVENEFIGVNCGIMDQFSIAMGQKDKAMLLDCETLAYEYIPFVLQEHSLVIMNSNKKRELADSKYNQRRSECEAALDILRRRKALKNLCQASVAEVEEQLSDATLRRRARHVVTENERVKQAKICLMQGDMVGFGQLMRESHASLRQDYEVTGRELDCLVDLALKAPGCIGARMTGAGFGGCAIALVKRDAITAFSEQVGAGYSQATGLKADFHVAAVSDGVKILD
ncbi:galactokinase [Azotosporobacter soli]|uniref:galactokinase n=1 Tax=Azotosporobacter soli TaxID=3055040 RepID=UPI0031FED64C